MQALRFHIMSTWVHEGGRYHKETAALMIQGILQSMDEKRKRNSNDKNQHGKVKPHKKDWDIVYFVGKNV
jgi:hypothetical protein